MGSAGNLAIVDLRSDTVTQPTQSMRKAMAQAEVGDDGYGEDPTVNRLEAVFAERIGKEASLFVPSGTMANQIALRCATRPGSAVIAGAHTHIVAYELGAGAMNASIHFIALEDTEGVLTSEAIREARAASQYHQPHVDLVCLEDTHMASGGTVWTTKDLEAVEDASSGTAIHLDGARIFNAEVQSGISVQIRANHASTVMACMSKGLGAPVGSLLAGPKDLCDLARIERSRFGGKMRQAGVLAACGLVALAEMVTRLGDDHARAKALANAVLNRFGSEPDLDLRSSTNIVVFRRKDPEAFLNHLLSRDVKAGMIGPGVIRLMTHFDVTDEGIERAIRAIEDAP